jgi:hypothetical protein
MNYAVISSALAFLAASRRTNQEPFSCFGGANPSNGSEPHPSWPNEPEPQLAGAESPPAGVLVAPFNHFQGFAKTKPMGKT